MKDTLEALKKTKLDIVCVNITENCPNRSHTCKAANKRNDGEISLVCSRDCVKISSFIAPLGFRVSVGQCFPKQWIFETFIYPSEAKK